MGRVEPQKITFETFNKNILIIIEDSGNELKFYNKIIQSVYPQLRYTIESSNGFGGIKATLQSCMNDKYDNCILIYDSGARRSQIKNIDRQLNSYKTEHSELANKITIFSPICFEQVLVQFTELDTAANIPNTNKVYNKYTEFKDIITQNSEKYMDFISDIALHSPRSTSEQGFEALIEKLTSNNNVNRIYEYIHGDKQIGKQPYLSDCWMENCCYDTNIICEHRISNKHIASKIELIALESIVIGLILIINNILDYNYTKYIEENYIDKQNRIHPEFITKYIRKLVG